MSLSTTASPFNGSEPSLSNDSTIIASPSTSTPAVTSSDRSHSQSHTERRPSYLDVPSFRPSRPSLDSTYSELSELSFHSDELQTRHPLIRSISPNGSAARRTSTAGVRSPRPRILTALHSFYVNNYGALLVLCSQLFGAGMNVSTRLLETPGAHGKPMHPYQILFVRQSITAGLCTSYGLYSKSVPHFPFGPREVRWLLVLRGVSGFFGVFGMYFSLLYLPLSEATVLTFLAPILTCYLCSFVIPGESFSRQQQMAAFVSLVGVIFIAQPASLFASSSSSSDPPQPSNPASAPPSNSTTTAEGPQHPTPDQHLAAIGIAMLGVLGSTGALTSIRSIGTRAHAFISINYFSVWCSIVSLACLIIFPDVKFRLPGNLTEWSLLVSLGLCGFVMQFLLTAGLSYKPPTHGQSTGDVQPGPKIRDLENTGLPGTIESGEITMQASSDRNSLSDPSSKPKSSGSGTRATSMVYTQMLFALAGDKLVFGVTPGTMSWVGSVLILAGAVWVASARDSEANKGKDVPPIQEREGPIGSDMHSRDGIPLLRLTEQTRAKGDDDGVGVALTSDIDDHDMANDDDVDDDDKERRDDRGYRHGPVESLETHPLRPTISGS